MARVNAIDAFNPYVTSAQVIGAYNNKQNNQQVAAIDQVKTKAPSFGQLTGKSEGPIAPPNAQNNFFNGLAPGNQAGMFAGEINGKENVLGKNLYLVG